MNGNGVGKNMEVVTQRLTGNYRKGAAKKLRINLGRREAPLGSWRLARKFYKVIEFDQLYKV